MKGIISELSDPVELAEIDQNYKLFASEKLSRGNVMLDLRCWAKWHQDGQFHPTRNGLMMVRSTFDQIRPQLEAFLDAHK